VLSRDALLSLVWALRYYFKVLEPVFGSPNGNDFSSVPVCVSQKYLAKKICAYTHAT
jgi:hypothetical protein